MLDLWGKKYLYLKKWNAQTLNILGMVECWIPLRHIGVRAFTQWLCLHFSVIDISQHHYFGRLELCLFKFNAKFSTYFSQLLSTFMPRYDNVLIWGDFNFHLWQTTGQRLFFIFWTLNLVHWISGLTHCHGHTLDSFITQQGYFDYVLLLNMNIAWFGIH